jgi:hypothetical protein
MGVKTYRNGRPLSIAFTYGVVAINVRRLRVPSTLLFNCLVLPLLTITTSSLQPTIYVHFERSNETKRFVRSLDRRRVKLPSLNRVRLLLCSPLFSLLTALHAQGDSSELGRLQVLEEGDTFIQLESTVGCVANLVPQVSNPRIRLEADDDYIQSPYNAETIQRLCSSVRLLPCAHFFPFCMLTSVSVPVSSDFSSPF